MQTFLPYPSLIKSLQCLDTKRLGKQRVEAWQILDILEKVNRGETPGYWNHPAVKMWRGYEDCLALYYNFSLKVWSDRGYTNDKLKLIPREITLGIDGWANPFSIGPINPTYFASYLISMLYIIGTFPMIFPTIGLFLRVPLD